jgi:hypothetical protein
MVFQKIVSGWLCHLPETMVDVGDVMKRHFWDHRMVMNGLMFSFGGGGIVNPFDLYTIDISIP